jgi:hypothetical protein
MKLQGRAERRSEPGLLGNLFDERLDGRLAELGQEP